MVDPQEHLLRQVVHAPTPEQRAPEEGMNTPLVTANEVLLGSSVPELGPSKGPFVHLLELTPHGGALHLPF